MQSLIKKHFAYFFFFYIIIYCQIYMRFHLEVAGSVKSFLHSYFYYVYSHFSIAINTHIGQYFYCLTMHSLLYTVSKLEMNRTQNSHKHHTCGDNLKLFGLHFVILCVSSCHPRVNIPADISPKDLQDSLAVEERWEDAIRA